MVYEIPAGLDYLNPMFGLYVCWLSPISDVSFQVPDVESGGFEEQRARALITKWLKAVPVTPVISPRFKGEPWWTNANGWSKNQKCWLKYQQMLVFFQWNMMKHGDSKMFKHQKFWDCPWVEDTVASNCIDC